MEELLQNEVNRLGNKLICYFEYIIGVIALTYETIHRHCIPSMRSTCPEFQEGKQKPF